MDNTIVISQKDIKSYYIINIHMYFYITNITITVIKWFCVK